MLDLDHTPDGRAIGKTQQVKVMSDYKKLRYVVKIISDNDTAIKS